MFDVVGDDSNAVMLVPTRGGSLRGIRRSTDIGRSAGSAGGYHGDAEIDVIGNGQLFRAGLKIALPPFQTFV